jgi:hypothetical protein
MTASNMSAPSDAAGSGGVVKAHAKKQPSGARHARAPPAEPPPFTVGDLRRAVPEELFVRSALKSFLHLGRDLLVVAALAALNYAVQTSPAVPLAVRWAAWPVYWYFTGVYLTGVWVIAHECGHQAFSSSKLLNDTVGLVLVSSGRSRRSGGRERRLTAPPIKRWCVARFHGGRRPPSRVKLHFVRNCRRRPRLARSTRRCWCRTTPGPSRTRTTTPTRAPWRTTRCLCQRRAATTARPRAGWRRRWRSRRWAPGWASRACCSWAGRATCSPTSQAPLSTAARTTRTSRLCRCSTRAGSRR